MYESFMRKLTIAKMPNTCQVNKSIGKSILSIIVYVYSKIAKSGNSILQYAIIKRFIIK